MDLKKALVFDAVVLAVYAFSANPAITGVPVHEWAGIAVLLAVVVHTAMHFNYIADTLLAASHRKGVRLAKTVFDVALIFAFALCAVSGVMVSGTVLQVFGLYAEGYYFWAPLHAASAKVLLAMLLVHAVANWKLIATGFKRKESEHDE